MRLAAAEAAMAAQRRVEEAQREAAAKVRLVPGSTRNFPGNLMVCLCAASCSCWKHEHVCLVGRRLWSDARRDVSNCFVAFPSAL